MGKWIACLAFFMAAGYPLAGAHCAPGPDSPYFFRDLAEQRVEAKYAGNRGFFERLLSEHFEMRSGDGHVVGRRDFIDGELTQRAAKGRPFYKIRNFSLLEHRKGFVVASYLISEGTTQNGSSQTTERWLRDEYHVEGGQWRLAVTRIADPAEAPLAAGGD